MKKTITINISGLVFNIEEDAYSALKNYLENIGNKFNNLDERQEIIEDIEARIAELFTERLNRNKEVINEKDVAYIQEVMGSPDNFEGEDSESSNEKSEHSSPSEEKKKLFRDSDNKVVGGVCAGISNYFGWNISIVRLIFILTLLLLGTGFWIYIVLWILIPEAKSTSEKLAMKGKNANVKNIETFITNFKEDVKNIDTEPFSENVKKHSSSFNDFLVNGRKKINERFQPEKNIGKAVKFIINLILAIIGIKIIILGIGFLIALLKVISNADWIYFSQDDFNVSYNTLNLFLDNPDWVKINVIVLFSTIGIGLILLGTKFFHTTKKLSSRLKFFSRFNFVIFIFSLLGIFGLLIVNNVGISKYSTRNTETIDYNTIVVEKMVPTNTEGSKKNIQFDIVKGNVESPTLEIEKKSKGIQTNKMPLTNYELEYEIQDSVIRLSPEFYVKNKEFQKKEINVTLYIPEKDSITVINKMEE